MSTQAFVVFTGWVAFIIVVICVKWYKSDRGW